MSIKKYLKSNEQEDWINYIIESLLGTSENFTVLEDEYLSMGFCHDALCEKVDNYIWLCESCGWWVEVSETNEDGICEDCQ